MTLNAAPIDLTGKTAVVTGASGGIGMATAERFAASGATDIGETSMDNGSFDLSVGDFRKAAPERVSANKLELSFRTAAVFLASDQSSCMTAETIGFDGGNGLR